MNAIGTATSGMIAAVASFDKAAGAIASPTGDPIQAVAQSVQAKASFGANAAVLKVADKMMGSLLDIVA